MSLNWVNSTDMLADAGIIDFDAAAYITGSRPRYMGSPQFPFAGVPNLNLSGPSSDVYGASDNKIVKNPSWKKWLFGVLAVGGAVYGYKKLGGLPKTVGTFINNIFGKIKGFFK